jgi:hypothetical protein
MNPFNRKTQARELLEALTESLDTLSGSSAQPGKGKKALIAAGGVAARTAASAGISSLRRREEGSRDES